uniref:Uncharacterized protein n=1 Tax=Anguilla anguilla TaxID=7936 RepID=A0A0E9SVU3_ANGAN
MIIQRRYWIHVFSALHIPVPL